MIFGVGIDLVDVERIGKALKKQGPRFITRLAHPEDLKFAPSTATQKAQYWAARFAAKEAFAKALGTGIGKDVSFKEVGVAKQKNGKPDLRYSTRLHTFLKKQKITRTHISITHTETTAAAVVILETGK
jgi:holo-[acyl-carrier protein] synthase